jgi:uncharacterized membrane protein YgcG
LYTYKPFRNFGNRYLRDRTLELFLELGVLYWVVKSGGVYNLVIILPTSYSGWGSNGSRSGGGSSGSSIGGSRSGGGGGDLARYISFKVNKVFL